MLGIYSLFSYLDNLLVPIPFFEAKIRNCLNCKYNCDHQISISSVLLAVHISFISRLIPVTSKDELANLICFQHMGLHSAVCMALQHSCRLGHGFESRILGDPGATSRDDGIFSGESLLLELKSPWELILTEPVPEVIEFRPANWPEKDFSVQLAMRSSRVTLSPSCTK